MHPLDGVFEHRLIYNNKKTNLNPFYPNIRTLLNQNPSLHSPSTRSHSDVVGYRTLLQPLWRLKFKVRMVFRVLKPLLRWMWPPLLLRKVPPYVPTPIKNPDFDSEFAMEEEGWCTDEEEEITTHESLNQIEKSATVYDLPIPFPPITNLSVDGKRPELNVGDKPDVQTKVLQPVGLNVDFRQNNVWENHGKLGLSIADRIRRSKEAAKVRIEYFPPVKTPEGKSRMLITKDDLLKSAKAYTWHLYGYFLGTSMDFNRNHEAYNVNVVASFLSSYKDHLEPAIANLRKLLQSLKGYQYIIVPDEEFLHDIKQRGNTEQEYLDAKAKIVNIFNTVESIKEHFCSAIDDSSRKTLNLWQTQVWKLLDFPSLGPD
ncbi:hypothetical protein HanRHA438_Chr15g0692361 [Helianthus annuus]|nr:hypothetical protein HanRHA438_Chr15g0692361 [Helianthus annuus]